MTQELPVSRIRSVRVVRLDPDLMQSVRQNGIQKPITIRKNRTVIDGESRLKVAKELGFQTILCNVKEE